MSSSYRSAYFWQIEKTHGESDRRHVFNAMVVYELPFGAGHAFGPANVVARALVSGWRLSSITRVRSGLPCGIMGGLTESVRINGEWGSGDLLGARPRFLGRTAFMSPAP